MSNNKKLTARMIKDLALKIGGGGGGVEIVGIAPISRFKNAPERMHPKNIFPDCKSVISVVQPIPRSTYRGITEGTHWNNYTYYSYNRLNTAFRPMVTRQLACFIEDHGFEAVPVYPGVPEVYPGTPAPVPGRPVADVNLNIRIAAMACGLGEIGWSKVFIHPVYGPRVRIGNILTDAELEYDEMIKPGTLCDRCMRCVPTCPGNAIPSIREGRKITITLDDKEYSWGDVNMGRCTATHHGINYLASPFLKRFFPGFNLEITESTMSEELAYKITHSLGGAVWRDSTEFPGGWASPYIRQISAHCGYLAVCGAKGCIRACMEHQEKTKNIGQNTFKTPVFPEKPWQLCKPADDPTGGVVEKVLHTELYQVPATNPGVW